VRRINGDRGSATGHIDERKQSKKASHVKDDAAAPKQAGSEKLIRLIEYPGAARLADRGAYRKVRVARVFTDRRSETENVLDQGLFVDSAEIILVAFSQREDSHNGTEAPEREYTGNEQIYDPMVPQFQQARTGRNEASVECDVVHGSIPVQADFEPILIDGEFIEIEDLGSGKVVWQRNGPYALCCR
jgi:hypothetical protein